MSTTTPFVPTDELDHLRAALRTVLDRHSAPADVFAQINTDRGFDPEVWATLATGLGITALIVPERFGGLGCGQVELGAALEEIGAALLCGPYFSTVVLGTNALLLSADEEVCGELLPAVAAGNLLVSLGVDPNRSDDPLHPPARVCRTSGGWTLSASDLLAVDGMEASVLLVVAADEAGTASMFAVRLDGGDVQRAPLRSLDLTRRLARVTLSAVPARLVGEPGAGPSILASLWDRVAVAQAAEQVGGAARCLDDAVAHTMRRIQFGRPLASFQAVKHACADLLTDVEMGRSAARYAAWVADAEPDRLPAAAATAAVWCAPLFARAAEESLQLHGGLGVTWEHHAHLYLRRAVATCHVGPDVRYHRGRLALLIAGRS